MNIVITPDLRGEECEPVTYERVSEFGLAGTVVSKLGTTKGLYHSHGDPHGVRERLSGLSQKLAVIEITESVLLKMHYARETPSS